MFATLTFALPSQLLYLLFSPVILHCLSSFFHPQKKLMHSIFTLSTICTFLSSLNLFTFLLRSCAPYSPVIPHFTASHFSPSCILFSPLARFAPSISPLNLLFLLNFRVSYSPPWSFPTLHIFIFSEHYLHRLFPPLTFCFPP